MRSNKAKYFISEITGFYHSRKTLHPSTKNKRTSKWNEKSWYNDSCYSNWRIEQSKRTCWSYWWQKESFHVCPMMALSRRGAKEQNKSFNRKIYNMTKRSDFNRTRKTLLSRICFHNNWRDNIIYSDDFLTWWFEQSFTCIVWKTAFVLFSNTRAALSLKDGIFDDPYCTSDYLNCKELIKYCCNAYDKIII